MFKTLTDTIDWLHKPFEKLIPQQTFRYAVAGGINMIYGLVQYWFIFNFIIDQKDIDLGFVMVSAPIASFLINFVITFFTGFFLTRNIAFSKSEVNTKAQIVRYLGVVAVNFVINYVGLRFMVRELEFYPSIANALIQVVTVAISFLINKFYTFKA